MSKIQMTTPLVEMDGDEMTRILWKMIKDELILPFVDLKSEYYDLGLPEREKTKDQVTWDASYAAKKYGVADVTIGYRLKKDAEKRAAEKAAEPVQTDGKRPLDIADLRARREAGETYEHIGKVYGGWTEDEVHAFMIQKGKEERGGQD